MQRIAPIQCGRKYAVNRREVTAVLVRSYGPKADFAKLVTLEAEDGSRFKLVQWGDGSIYRVTAAN